MLCFQVIHYFLGGGGGVGGQRGWVEGSHCENVPVKNNAYLFSFYKGNFSFSYFSFICGRIDGTHFSCLHTVYLKQPASSPQKSNDCPHCRGMGHAMPSWFCLFLDRDNLPPKT